MELRGEAAELHEYSASKFGRLALFLGALAEKTDRQDQAAQEVEARIAPLRQERRRLFNDLLAMKGEQQLTSASGRAAAAVEDGPLPAPL
eukprot:SM007776S22007  [mRNA]  locus=s7776:41:446:- [translate_table: standard]